MTVTPAVTNASAAGFPKTRLIVESGGMVIQAWYQLFISLWNRTGAELGNQVSESGQQTLATVVAVAHRQPIRPKQWKASIINISAELGYALNDEVDVTKSDDGANGCSTVVDSTNVTWVCSNTALTIERKDTGARAAIAPAKWKLILRTGIRL